MAVLTSIRNLFASGTPVENAPVIPAPPTSYSVRPLTERHAKEVLTLNFRCFKDGENYTKHTFAFLFNEPKALSYQVVTADGTMAGFVFVILNDDGTAHLTTLGVAPEHRRRGIADLLLGHIETALRIRNVTTVVLEVRLHNIAAQQLYVHFGYSTVRRIEKYYTDGEDCYMMVKSLI